MNMKLNYGPNNLAYYTTWWLTSKRSNSSQTAQSESVCNSIKSDDDFFMIQQNINQHEVQSYCCIPIKRSRRK